MSKPPITMRVVSAVADKQQVVFYQDDGSTVTIKAGDPRLAKLMDQIIPITVRGEVAVVSLEDFSVYAEMEERSNGLIKFFKVAKKTIASLFKRPPEDTEVELPPQEIVPVAPPVQPVAAPAPVAARTEANTVSSTGSIPSDPKPLEKLTKTSEAPDPTPTPTPAKSPRETISKDLKPLGKSEEINVDEETIVAVIGDTVIPNIEKIRPYIIHALKHNSTKAVENFLKRLVPMMSKRDHSVEDLMRFLERGDLPLADDGSIIAYKVLRKKNGNNQDVFVDCHTGKVTQRVGSYVVVNEELVDKNRRNECSNGLHIARRAYLSNFSGDVCVLCKIAPEDVVTVPHNDPNKVRVMGYHILFKLSPDAYTKLKNNRHMTDSTEAATFLARAIKGDHIGRIEEVRIRGQKGADVLITALKHDGTKGKSITEEELNRGKALDDPTNSGAVNPKALNKAVNEEVEKASKEEAKPTRNLNINTLPDIQKFINTYGGATFEMANFAKDQVAKGSDVHRAFGSHAVKEFRVFVGSFAKDVFNTQVNAIFAEVAPKPKKVNKKPEAKKAKPITKDIARLATKAVTKKTTTKVVNEVADKVKTNKPLVKAAKETEKLNKPIPVTKVNKPEPKKEKTKAPAKKPEVNTKKTVSKATSKASAQASTPSKAKTPASPNVDPKKAEVFRLADEGLGPTEISKATGVSRSTLQGWLKSRKA